MKGMEDIELVIKIQKAYYELVLERCKDPVLLNAFKNGTPLTKEHGADIIKDFKDKVKSYGKDYRFTQEEILNILERYEIKYAPTNIEAESEEKE